MSYLSPELVGFFHAQSWGIKELKKGKGLKMLLGLNMAILSRDLLESVGFSI